MADLDELLARAVAALPAPAREAVGAGAVGAVLADGRSILRATPYAAGILGRTPTDEAPISWIGLTPAEFIAQDAIAIAQARVAGISEPLAKEYEVGGRRVPVVLACGLLGGDDAPLFVLLARAEDEAARAAVEAWCGAPDADLRPRVAA